VAPWYEGILTTAVDGQYCIDIDLGNQTGIAAAELNVGEAIIFLN